ncbi:MAG: hypothetical protein RR623_01275 [Bacilli bacterium]
MSRVRLGKRPHQVIRHSGATGGWVDGEWVETNPTETITILANIQPNYPQYMTKLLPEGDREKEAVWISSDHWLYTSRSGTNPLEADIVLYRGSEWKVMVVRPFGNFGEHCEAVAVKYDKKIIPRLNGIIGQID